MPAVGKIEAEDSELNKTKAVLSGGDNILLRRQEKVS